MKKLMTAFAACMLAGFVSAQITSLNIVGYQTLSGNEGFTVVAPTFITTAGAAQTFTYSSIQGTFQVTDNLQFFDSLGNVNFTAIWLNEDAGKTPGWYDSSDWDVSLTDATLPAGSAFFAQLAAAGSIMFVGEVDKAATVITAGEGFTVMGNCRPYGVKYSALVATGLQVTDNLQYFDPIGNVNFTAIWLNEDAGKTPGWYDSSDWDVSLADVEIPAGQGFFLQCAAAGATVTIPAPVL